MAVLGALMGLASISTDFYLPAMPAMAKALAARPGEMEWTVAAFLFGFSAGQLFWGPISDRFGRKRPLLVGLLLFIAGSIGCASAASLSTIIAWRLMQALGACSGVVLARAIVRDKFSGVKAADYLSTLIVIMTTAPIVAPLIGGQVLLIAGWRAIFLLLAIVGAIIILSMAAVHETMPQERREAVSLRETFAKYPSFLTDSRIMIPAITVSTFYFGVFAFVAASPQVLIVHYAVPAQFYGFIFGASTIGVAIANIINKRLVRRKGAHSVLFLGSALAALSGTMCLTAALTDWGGLWGFAIPLLLYIAINGLINANAVTLGMADFPQQAGTASALLGALQYGGGIFGSAFVGIIANGGASPLGLSVAAAGIACFVTQMAGAVLRAKRDSLASRNISSP